MFNQSQSTGSRPEPSPALTVSGFLERAPGGQLPAPGNLWGFGGLHGGLALAAAAARIAGTQPGILRSITGRFDSAIRTPFHITAEPVRSGGAISAARASMASEDQTHAAAWAILSTGAPLKAPVLAPPPPVVPHWKDCAVFTVPPAFVPFAASTEIRPAGTTRPFGGHAEARLCAWIRLLDDDAAPDPARLIFLADALAPSYSAVLTELAPMPTLELSVHLSGRPAGSSPWVLLSARTPAASPEGWITEDIDLWNEDGIHLAAARQLRILRTPREP